MTIAHRLTEAEYEEFVFANPDRKWELVEGQLREKPGLSWEHDDIIVSLAILLQLQLDRAAFASRKSTGRSRHSPGTIFIPDLMVVPTRLGENFAADRETCDLRQPLPLVVEVWSNRPVITTSTRSFLNISDEVIWRSGVSTLTSAPYRLERQLMGPISRPTLSGGTLFVRRRCRMLRSIWPNSLPHEIQFFDCVRSAYAPSRQLESTLGAAQWTKLWMLHCHRCRRALTPG